MALLHLTYRDLRVRALVSYPWNRQRLVTGLNPSTGNRFL